MVHEGAMGVAALEGHLSQARVGLGVIGEPLQELAIGLDSRLRPTGELGIYAAVVEIVERFRSPRVAGALIVGVGPAKIPGESEQEGENGPREKGAHHEGDQGDVPGPVRGQRNTDTGGIHRGEIRDSRPERQGHEDAGANGHGGG